MSTTLTFTPMLGAYLDPSAIAIVVGGTAIGTVLRTPRRDLARALAAVRVLFRRRFDATALVAQVASLGRIAQRHGVIALDRSVIRDPDVAAAVAAIVDGAGPDEIATLLAEQRETRDERHATAADVWAAAAELAPAMGMIGTLIGLVGMFTAMDDPQSIGGAMAIALLTTLYGAVLASLVAMPIAARLRRAARIEASERQRIEAPLIGLAERERPRLRAVPNEAAA
ncbi:chemotaxis protein MotA [Hephaestia caeni]|uniref:Chemotaxis protein MotA n=1 Tax=Hephaestia caeni TaxID=645617 RepID=A0A397P5N4_9SPHN|nr:MotA/TolQ/ExbB proton channel family protein [Hephaestia caeni]RIA44502.1 chemotaxis protein MotA [Hephaestia caeni]